MQIRATRFVLATIAVMGFLIGVPLAIGTAQDTATPAASPEATVGVVRHVLSESEPEAAAGQDLALVEYTIPAGAVLAIHIHPGVQMATVESGSLTYHVIEGGSVPVTRADGTEEIIGPGESTTFKVGDAWVEPEGMVHYGENLTDEPVVLMAASLLSADEPAAIPVEVATPAA
jgi:quercetin dioxygenase-like cupin family protein